MELAGDASTPRLRVETRLTMLGRGVDRPGQPLNVPILPPSNFRAATGTPGREYARGDGTPGWEALEELLGDLEGGRAVCFSSGMGAISAVLELLPTGARVVVPRDSYGGVRALLADGLTGGRWQVHTVDMTDDDALATAIDDADLVWLETPSNPLLEVVDIAAVVTQRDEEHARLVRRREVAGATPGALECFLALRGARTLALRLRQAQDSAGELAVGSSRIPRSRGSVIPGSRATHTTPARPHRWRGSAP